MGGSLNDPAIVREATVVNKTSFLPMTCLTALLFAAPVHAAILYDLTTASTSGGGQNTFAASTTNAVGAGGTFTGSTLPGNLKFTDGTSAAQSFDYFLGTFSSQSLTVGSAIVLTFTATANGFQNVTQDLRFGLFNVGTATTGSGTPAGNSFSTATGYRSDYGASNAANGIRERTGSNANLFATGASPLLTSGTQSSNFTLVPADGTTYSGSLRIDLLAGGSVSITSQLGGLSSVTVTDATAPFTTFNAFGFFLDSAVATKASLNFTNLQIASVPEPTTYALLAMGIGLVFVHARRKARREISSARCR